MKGKITPRFCARVPGESLVAGPDNDRGSIHPRRVCVFVLEQAAVEPPTAVGKGTLPKAAKAAKQRHDQMTLKRSDRLQG